MPALNEKCCPQCRKQYSYVSFEAHKPYPFCAERCRLIDMGAWLDEEYALCQDLSNDLELLAEADMEDQDFFEE